jgi:intracellular septation protein
LFDFADCLVSACLRRRQQGLAASAATDWLPWCRRRCPAEAPVPLATVVVIAGHPDSKSCGSRAAAWWTMMLWISLGWPDGAGQRHHLISAKLNAGRRCFTAMARHRWRTAFRKRHQVVDGAQMSLPDAVWRKVNFSWAGIFAVMA